jgi:membrane-bound lytic murein transglycosylase A
MRNLKSRSYIKKISLKSMTKSLLALSRKSLLFFLSSFFLIFVWPSCTLYIKPPGKPALEQLSIKQINSYEWVDYLNYKGLIQAIEQSVRYYERLPLTKSFKYGELNYSPEEMVASINLFLEIIRDYRGKEKMMHLREKFLIFESKNSQGEAFFTGYYEPLLEGSTVPTEGFYEPIYETPDDLIEVDLGIFASRWKNEKIVGRLEGNRLVPYDSREEIVYKKSLKDRAKPIAYVNGIELFFLQVQGSGLIRLPDGSVKRVNYAQKNGYPYRSIGKILKDKIPTDEMSLQSIKKYLYANPDEVHEILSYNQSYVFFREVEEGPLGNIEVPLTPNRSIAMDKRAAPQGGLAFIETELPILINGRVIGWKPVKRFVLVQDTGGAIRNHGRVDIFLGKGENAGMVAGHLKHRGRAFLLVARKEFL